MRFWPSRQVYPWVVFLGHSEAFATFKPITEPDGLLRRFMAELAGRCNKCTCLCFLYWMRLLYAAGIRRQSGYGHRTVTGVINFRSGFVQPRPNAIAIRDIQLRSAIISAYRGKASSWILIEFIVWLWPDALNSRFQRYVKTPFWPTWLPLPNCMAQDVQCITCCCG